MDNKSPVHILLVEDNPADARFVQEMLREAFDLLHVKHVTRLSDIPPHSAQNYDLVLLDLNLPDSTGLNTVLNAHDLMPDIPIVVMTGLENEELSISAIQSGAQDYLVKNKTDSLTLLKTIQYALARFQAFKEINEMNDKQRVYLSSHDVLTGLPNQQLLFETLRLMIEKHEIIKKSFAIVLLKIYELDSIITHFGHSAKDELIKKIANALTTLFPDSVTVARYNEDTFVFLFSKSLDAVSISKNLFSIQMALAKPLSIAGKEYFPSYNIGTAIFPFDGKDAEDLIKNAQVALTKASQLGLGEYEIFSENISYLKKAEGESILFGDLGAALERDEFFIVYQPQVLLGAQKVSGVEALLRWRHPKHGVILPQDFIYIAEEAHLISAIGEWVLNRVIQEHEVWKQKAPGQLPLRISVNVSAQQLQNDNFIPSIQSVLERYDMDRKFLVLELTESIFIDQAERVIEKLHKLKNFGIQLAIDDFGKGYSALSYLSHLPVDHLKLDMAFIEKNIKNTPTSTIVKSIINLAHSLNLTVIAEGVEKKDQINLLKRQKCDEVQGNYFSHPLSENALTSLISRGLRIQPQEKRP